MAKQACPSRSCAPRGEKLEAMMEKRVAAQTARHKAQSKLVRFFFSLTREGGGGSVLSLCTFVLDEGGRLCCLKFVWTTTVEKEQAHLLNSSCISNGAAGGKHVLRDRHIVVGGFRKAIIVSGCERNALLMHLLQGKTIGLYVARATNLHLSTTG